MLILRNRLPHYLKGMLGLQQFVPAAKELEQGHWTNFQPHYLTHLCPEVYIGTRECESQCIHNGTLLPPWIHVTSLHAWSHWD